MKDFMRYLTGAFMLYASIAWMIAIIVMLAFYITGNTGMVWIIFSAQSLLFKVGITWQFIRFKQYKAFKTTNYIQGWFRQKRNKNLPHNPVI